MSSTLQFLPKRTGLLIHQLLIALMQPGPLSNAVALKNIHQRKTGK